MSFRRLTDKTGGRKGPGGGPRTSLRVLGPIPPAAMALVRACAPGAWSRSLTARNRHPREALGAHGSPQRGRGAGLHGKTTALGFSQAPHHLFLPFQKAFFPLSSDVPVKPKGVLALFLICLTRHEMVAQPVNSPTQLC